MQVFNKRIFFLLILTILLLTSCGKKEVKQAEGIIVTSPEVAEIIAALGGIDQIIARTEYCDFPSEMLEIESIGDFSTIDIERVIVLRPRIIFTAAYEQEEIYDKLTAFGIEVIKIHSNSLISYYDNIKFIADKIGLSNNADKLVKNFEEAIDSLNIVDNKPKVYFEISSNLGTITNNSFIGEMIITAGGLNIFGNEKKDFLIAKNEDIVQANPDIIIALSYVSKKEIEQRRGWQNINAVKENKIYTVEDINIDTVMRTIPRSIDAIKTFNKWFSQNETSF